MIPNPSFDNDMTSWTVVFGQGAAAASPSPLGGAKSFSNTVNQAPWVSSDARIPTNPHWTYEVRGSFRRQNTNGSAGGIYLAVRLFNAAGADISGDGTWWFYPASNVQLTDTAWHTFSAKFGSGTGRQFPAAARYMSVGAILNYDGAVAGNRNYEVTALQIAPAIRPPLYFTDARAGCPPGGATGGTTVVVTSGAMTLDRPAFVHVTAQTISLSTGRRDAALYVDGTAVTYSLDRTEVLDWLQHNVEWSGQLTAGAHTIELRGNSNMTSPDGYGCGGGWGNMTVVFTD